MGLYIYHYHIYLRVISIITAPYEVVSRFSVIFGVSYGIMHCSSFRIIIVLVLLQYYYSIITVLLQYYYSIGASPGWVIEVHSGTK